MRRGKHYLLIFILAAFTSLLWADLVKPTPGLAFCTTVSGMSCMHLEGMQALLTQNQTGISFLDLHTPEQAIFKECVQTSHNVTDMAFAQGHAYLAVSEQGLLVLDIQDPQNCRLLGSPKGFQDKIKRLSAFGDLLLAELTREGLVLLDISDPVQPLQIANFKEPILVKDMLLAAGYAYVAGSNGTLHVYDLQDPDLPIKTAILPLRASPLALGLSQDRLYMTTKEGQMHILDISAPESPDLQASINIGKCTVAALAEDSIFLVNQAREFRILDISDLAQPRKSKSFKLPRQALALCIKDNTAYLHLLQNQLWVLDLKDLASGAHQVQILDLNILASK